MKRLSIVGFTMILVIIPFCLYYLFFVESQNEYFTKRNFRVLAGIGSQMKSKIDNLGTSLINAVKSAQQEKKEIVSLNSSKPEKKDEKKPPIKGEKQGDKSDKLKSSIALIDHSGTSLKYDPGLWSQQTAQQAQSTDSQRQNRIQSRPRPSNANTSSANSNSRPAPPPSTTTANTSRPDSRSMPPNVTAGRNSRTHTRVRASSTAQRPDASGPEPTVALSVRAEQGSFWLNLEYRAGKTAGTGNLVAKSEINKLFDPFLARYVIDENNQTQNPLFDEVLVAEQQDGRVIFEHGQSGLSIVSLDSLRNEKGGKLELDIANQSSSLADVQLAGAAYKLFVQPVRLTLSGSEDDKNQGVRWVVCGLIRSDHFRDQTFAVSYTLLIMFMFLAVLAALSWPLLKLRLMGPKDRLRRSDFALTMFSALLGTALLAFLLVDVYTYVSLEKDLDTQLKNLAAGIRSNFQEELGSVVTQLWRFDEQLTTLASKERSGALADFHASTLPEVPKAPVAAKKVPGKKAPEKKVSEFKDLLAGTVDWKTAPYPYFNSVIWADDSGLQRIKWTTRPETTAFVPVSGRSYFTKARDGDMWTLGHEGRDFKYAFEPVHSKNTGENVAIVSTRVPNSKWVASIDTRLASLMGTVLPSGHGFAVINSTGDVLFHSDEVNNLEEQFFEECDNDRLLRAAVLARASEYINAPYLGKGHRLFVSPMPGTPWMLVVFRDKQMARTINLELLTLSLVLYLIFAVVALLVISVVYLPRRGERIRRLWPNEQNAGQYDRLIVMNAVLIVVFLVVALTVKNEALLLFCCFLLPSLATVLGAVVLRNATVGHDKSEAGVADRLRFLYWLPYRKGYALALVGSLILVSILPALGFFQIGRNFEMRLMVKLGQVSLARELERRAARINTQYASINIGSNEEKDEFLRARLDPETRRSNWDVYDSFCFETVRSGPPVAASLFTPEQPGKLNSLLTELRPLYNQTCVESQELARGASADGVWSWGQDAQGRFRLQKDKEGRNGEMSLALVSSVPPFQMPDTFPKWLLVIIGLGGMCALVYQLVRFVTRHFFFLDKDPPRAMLAGVTKLSTANNVAIVRPPMANGNGLDLANSHRIDLRQVSVWPGWANTVQSNPPRAGQTIVLDHFEQDMDDPAANREKLRAIEQFLSESRRVVVVSTVDPLRFTISAAGGNPAPVLNGAGTEASTKPEAMGENRTAAATAPGKAASESDQAAVRWSMALSTFVTVYSPDNAEADFVRENTGFLRIMRANRPWRYLENIGKEIYGEDARHQCNGLDRAAREEQINEVVDQARAYHQALWATCSQDERCALIHLALDGLISSKNTDVRQLIKRGLVIRDPGLRLMDESFRRFVISASRGEDIDAWRHAGGSNWELMKAPLLLILLSVSLFLFVTQKDVYDSSVSFVSALTAGLAALFKLLGMFQKKSVGGVDA
ncbi:MAG: hypothetical protein DMF60_05855 [Acidobacteria bacterium]|nr:MAG: hypothetical protein DMF60_05855 [Acidobacteriota bacterium]